LLLQKLAKKKEKALDELIVLGKACLNIGDLFKSKFCFKIVHKHSNDKKQKEKALDELTNVGKSCLDAGKIDNAGYYLKIVIDNSDPKSTQEKNALAELDKIKKARKKPVRPNKRTASNPARDISKK